VSAIINYVVGVGADMGQAPQRAQLEPLTDADRDDFLRASADQWRAMDPEEFPFLHTVAGEFEKHEDEDQLVAGLDLLLAGLRQQAEARG
jgi:hypothetical protein